MHESRLYHLRTPSALEPIRTGPSFSLFSEQLVLISETILQGSALEPLVVSGMEPSFSELVPEDGVKIQWLRSRNYVLLVVERGLLSERSTHGPARHLVRIQPALRRVRDIESSLVPEPVMTP